MATVVTVLRSGAEFGPEHVQAMQRQVRKWAPADTAFYCLSDVPVPGVVCIPLKYDWPGWWAKLELFRLDLPEDLLYTDLDNVIVGPIDEFFRPKGEAPVLQLGGWTALMWLPEYARGVVWDDFMQSPEGYMEYYARKNRPILNGIGNYGDAGFISAHYSYTNNSGITEYWEKMLPGQVPNIADFKLRTPTGNRPLPVHYWEKVLTGQVVQLGSTFGVARIVLCAQPNRPWMIPQLQKAYWCMEDV